MMGCLLVGVCICVSVCMCLNAVCVCVCRLCVWLAFPCVRLGLSILLFVPAYASVLNCVVVLCIVNNA
jgi:hypothetical protein